MITNFLRSPSVEKVAPSPTELEFQRLKIAVHEELVETLDLSELLGWANKMLDTNDDVREKLAAIKGYTNVDGVPEESLLKMAKLGVGIDNWMRDNELAASAIQCWTSLEEFYGVVPCTLMSMMSDGLSASACETDIAGVIGMHALACASGTPYILRHARLTSTSCRSPSYMATPIGEKEKNPRNRRSLSRNARSARRCSVRSRTTHIAIGSPNISKYWALTSTGKRLPAEVTNSSSYTSCFLESRLRMNRFPFSVFS